KPPLSVPFPHHLLTFGINPAPAGPNANAISATPALFEFLKKNVPAAGLYNPIVVIPSPSQSPASGINPAPAGPYGKLISATPPPFEARKTNAPIRSVCNP